MERITTSIQYNELHHYSGISELWLQIQNMNVKIYYNKENNDVISIILLVFI